MLAAVTSRSAIRLTRVVNPSFYVVATRCMSTTDKFKTRERVEEELFVKQNEKKFFEKKKNEMAAKMKQEELKHFEDVIAPAMAVAESLLSKTGDKVSDAGLEALAKWKTT